MNDEVMRDRITQLVAKGERVAQTVKPNPPNVFGMDPVVDTSLREEWRSQSEVFLVSLLGESHRYTKSFDSAFERSIGIDATKRGIGVLRAVQEDIHSGMLISMREMLHAEVFDDYLAMAEHLLKNGGYKDAAAVIAGSTLEGHIRQLCQKNGIATHVTRQGRSEPRKTSSLNDDLKQQEFISQVDWRSIQGWLDTRNDAAHGHYEKYEQGQVVLMVEGIRQFLTRAPA